MQTCLRTPQCNAHSMNEEEGFSTAYGVASALRDIAGLHTSLLIGRDCSI